MGLGGRHRGQEILAHASLAHRRIARGAPGSRLPNLRKEGSPSAFRDSPAPRASRFPPPLRCAFPCRRDPPKIPLPTFSARSTSLCAGVLLRLRSLRGLRGLRKVITSLFTSPNLSMNTRCPASY